MPTLERNFVFYRFFSDATVVEKMEFDGREISVGDLKQAIAEAKGLPKFDLVLENEATNKPYSRDGQMVQRNANVIVRRRPPVNPKKGSVIGVVLQDIWSADAVIEIGSDEEDERPAIAVRDCPPEYLCPLCANVYDKPRIAKCCGRSACTKCFEEHLACPLCKADWDMEYTEETVLNRRLAESVASLNLQYFRLPGQSKDDTSEVDHAKVEIKDEDKTKSEIKDETSNEMLALTNGVPDEATLPPGAASVGGAPPRMLPPHEFFAWQQALRKEKEKKEKKEKKKEKKEKVKAELQALSPEEKSKKIEELVKQKAEKRELKDQKKRKREEEMSGSKAGGPEGLTKAESAEPATKAANVSASEDGEVDVEPISPPDVEAISPPDVEAISPPEEGS